MRFADFYAGQVIEAGPYHVTAQEIVEFAQRYDPQWFHTDSERASIGRYGGLIASGWHTCAIAMRLLVSAALAGSESFASPGVSSIRWLAPVRGGDALMLRATILEKRMSGTRPWLGLLRWQWELWNQHGAQVLEQVVTSMFDVGPVEECPS